MADWTIKTGDLCIWHHLPRGGYGYIHVVPCVVMEVRETRTRIAVRKTDGSVVMRWVKPAALETARLDRNRDIAESIKSTVMGDWERKKLTLTRHTPHGATTMSSDENNRTAVTGPKLYAMYMDALGTIAAMDEQIATLTAERDDARRVADARHMRLLSLEWSKPDSDGEEAYCPACMALDGEQHNAGCCISEAIADSARMQALTRHTSTEPTQPQPRKAGDAQ